MGVQLREPGGGGAHGLRRAGGVGEGLRPLQGCVPSPLPAFLPRFRLPHSLTRRLCATDMRMAEGEGEKEVDVPMDKIDQIDSFFGGGGGADLSGAAAQELERAKARIASLTKRCALALWRLLLFVRSRALAAFVDG